MANVENITVTVRDEIIHNLFRELAEKIFEENKILVNSVDFKWLGYDMAGDNQLLDVHIDSQKRG